MNKRSHLEILGPVDTAFYYVDRPETPMNIGALTIYEGKIPFDEFFKLVDERIYRAPLYQQRVIQAPLTLGQPSWVLDPDFYVGNHVFRVELPSPGTEEQLRELTGHLISGMLDRAKPLWEIYLIDGLEGDRTAVLFKVHHCMVDGLAAVELFTMMMDLTPETPPSADRRPSYDPPYLPNATQMITTAIRADLPHRWGVIKKIGSDLGHLGSVLGDKEKRRQAFVGLANLINDNLSLIKQLPINGQNTGKMTVGWAEFSLAEVRAIRANYQASVNDVMLTILGGGLDLYLGDRAENVKQEFLRALVPVNMRMEAEKHNYGNRISVLPVDIPLGIRDPVERLQKIANYSQVMKQSSLTFGLDIVLTLPSLYPSFAQPLVWEIAPRAFSLLAHTWCTNVAGPQIPTYILGHQMQQCFGYFPLNPSMGLACVILSYNQRITMTLIADAGIIPDVLHLRDCLQEAYLALRQAANIPEIPLTNFFTESQSEQESSVPNAEAPSDPLPADASAEPVEVSDVDPTADAEELDALLPEAEALETFAADPVPVVDAEPSDEPLSEVETLPSDPTPESEPPAGRRRNPGLQQRQKRTSGQTAAFF